MAKKVWWHMSPGEIIVVILALLALGLAAFPTVASYALIDRP